MFLCSSTLFLSDGPMPSHNVPWVMLQVDASPTRRYGGSGLGLTISQKLAEAMGGTMWAESGGLGCGSTFRWTIACRQPGTMRHPPPTRPGALHLPRQVRRTGDLPASTKLQRLQHDTYFVHILIACISLYLPSGYFHLHMHKAAGRRYLLTGMHIAC